MEEQPSTWYTYASGAGVVLLGTAAFHAASVAQLVLMFRQEFLVIGLELLFSIAAVGHVACGAGLYNGSLRWNLAAVAVCGSGAVLGLSWFVGLLWFGGIGVLSLLCFLASAGSTLVSLMMLRITTRIEAARRAELQATS